MNPLLVFITLRSAPTMSMFRLKAHQFCSHTTSQQANGQSQTGRQPSIMLAKIMKSFPSSAWKTRTINKWIKTRCSRLIKFLYISSKKRISPNITLKEGCGNVWRSKRFVSILSSYNRWKTLTRMLIKKLVLLARFSCISQSFWMVLCLDTTMHTKRTRTSTKTSATSLITTKPSTST